MSFRNETLRRVVYALAMLTGVALVGMQFGCAQPLTTLRASRFPCAGRWIEPEAKSKAEVRLILSGDAIPPTPTIYWTTPRAAPGQNHRVALLEAKAEGQISPSAFDLSHPPLLVMDRPPPIADANAANDGCVRVFASAIH